MTTALPEAPAGEAAAPFGAHAPGPFAARAIALTRRLPDAWAAKRLGFLLRRLALARAGQGPFDVEAMGAKLRLHPHDNVCEKRILFFPQFFDPLERGLIGQAMAARREEGGVFLDIGANVGGYALSAAAVAGPRARIYAIEPQPVIFERLVTNVAQNPFGTVKALACALADKPGELTLFLDTRNRGESSVRVVGTGGTGSVRVPATTLLALARSEELTRIDAAKLDVEGAEDLVLAPFLADAPPSLWPGLLVIENAGERWQLDLPALLAAKGYREIARTRLNLAFARDVG